MYNILKKLTIYFNVKKKSTRLIISRKTAKCKDANLCKCKQVINVQSYDRYFSLKHTCF